MINATPQKTPSPSLISNRAAQTLSLEAFLMEALQTLLRLSMTHHSLIQFPILFGMIDHWEHNTPRRIPKVLLVFTDTIRTTPQMSKRGSLSPTVIRKHKR